MTDLQDENVKGLVIAQEIVIVLEIAIVQVDANMNVRHQGVITIIVQGNIDRHVTAGGRDLDLVIAVIVITIVIAINHAIAKADLPAIMIATPIVRPQEMVIMIAVKVAADLDAIPLNRIQDTILNMRST